MEINQTLQIMMKSYSTLELIKGAVTFQHLQKPIWLCGFFLIQQSELYFSRADSRPVVIFAAAMLKNTSTF